jgi:hypothetical protein
MKLDYWEKFLLKIILAIAVFWAVSYLVMDYWGM